MTKWQRPLYHPCIPLGENGSRATESEKHIQLSRTVATEGAVLLKNNNALLPFKKGAKVAVFGKAQIDYVKGGGGSGNTLVSYVRNIYQGLKMKSEHIEVFEPLSSYYKDYTQKVYDSGDSVDAFNEAPMPQALLGTASSMNPGILGMFDEAPIPADLLEQAKAFTDTAIITLCRYSREDADRRNDGTDTYFYLSKREQAMVQAVTDNFANVVVLLNVGAMIDTTWFAYNDKISSAIMLWQGGMEGGLAAADLLVGDVNPSGKLVDTCARTFDDYPSSEGFHESDDYVKYTEDIFVGYRYFETIPGKRDSVVYPFGYGLSYTTFSLSNMRASSDDTNISVTLTVKNTGACAGKEIVQVYYSAPAGKLDKPALELCGFAKTKLLEPGESEELCISFAIKDMRSYDDTGVISMSSFVMEKGIYSVYVGTSIRDLTELEYHYDLADDVVVEKLHTYCVPEKLDKRLRADGTYEQLECKPAKRATFSCDYKPADKPDVEMPYKLVDVAEGKIDLDTFMAQLTDEELCHLAGGQPNTGVANDRGMGNLERLGIPSIMTADGPAGLRTSVRHGVNTTAFPVATALACSWNLELAEAVGRAAALELKENHLSIYLAPALNIHRSPLCGRNFEYYSEDPFVSGKMAAANIKGIQSQNIVATPKHFVCNNKETNRFFSDSIVSERALREIYLKGFEICIKEAKPKLVMSSYNLLNGIAASENAELLTGILREEWGFEGMVVSDWWNLKDHVKEIKAGNDIKMPIAEPQVLLDALQDGSLKLEELAICIKRMLEMFLWLE